MSIGTELIPHGLHRIKKIRTHPIHFVNECQAGNAVLVHLPPNGFGLRLHPFDGSKNCHGSIENPQGPFDLGGKINVPRRINDIDAVVDAGERTVTCGPSTGNGRRSYRDAALALLFHPIGDCSPLMNLPNLVNNP